MIDAWLSIAITASFMVIVFVIQESRVRRVMHRNQTLEANASVFQRQINAISQEEHQGREQIAKLTRANEQLRNAAATTKATRPNPRMAAPKPKRKAVP